MADFILTRVKRKYTQQVAHPKISVSLATYKKLQEVALEADQSISSVANQAIDHALGELKWVEEE